MFKLFTFTLRLWILFFALSACSTQNEPDQSNKNSYIKLSTEGQFKEKTVIDQEQPITNSEDAPIEEEQKTIPIVPDTEQQTEQNQEISQALPNRPYLNTEPEPEENNNPAVQKKLPFQDFKERWNAISDDQASKLYIRQFDVISEQNETIYSTPLNVDHQLRITVKNGNINQLEMLTPNTPSSSTVFSMLGGWSQIMNILHPEIQLYHIDDFFNQIGVGPNADIKNVKNTTITYDRITYTITLTNPGYRFTAAFSN